MTTPTITTPRTETTAETRVETCVVPFTAGTRRAPRERDFGIGYGKSSGYASVRRYTTEWAGRSFRVA